MSIYETSKSPMEKEQKINKIDENNQLHQNFITKLKKITKLPSRKLYNVLKKNIVLFQIPIENMNSQLEDFIFKQQAEFAQEGVEDEIVEVRYNNYTKKFEQKVKRLKYEVVQYHNDQYKNKEKGEVDKYINEIQQEQKNEQFIEDIKALKNKMLHDQLKKIGDDKFIEEIQNDLLKEKQKLINLEDNEKNKALKKYEYIEDQKNYYRRLDDQQLELQEKFKKKNKTLQDSIKMKHYQEEDKKSQIKDIIQLQKKKQIQTGREIQEKLSKGKQRYQIQQQEKEIKIQQDNIQMLKKQQSCIYKKQSLEQQYEDKMNKILVLKNNQSEELLNFSKVSRQSSMLHKENKIKQIKQELLQKDLEDAQGLLTSNVSKITKSDINLKKLKQQKLEQISELHEIHQYKTQQIKDKQKQKSLIENKKIKEIEKLISSRNDKVKIINDKKLLEQKVKSEKIRIRSQNRVDILQENMKDEEKKQIQNKEWLIKKKEKINNIMSRMQLKNAIIRDFQEQVSEKKSMRRDMMEELDRICKTNESSKAEAMTKVFSKYY